MALDFGFEHRSDPLLPKDKFAKRQIAFAGCSLVMIFLSLVIGILGYHFLESFSWIDSLLNASMILGGMGPVSELRTNTGKIFASIYAIYCGAVLLIAIGVFMAPAVHRILHRFHVDVESQDD